MRRFRNGDGIVSGESGDATLQRAARQVAKAKFINLGDADCGFLFRLPQLSAEADLAELTRGLADGGWQVVIIDP